jgi:hypothetical protein
MLIVQAIGKAHQQPREPYNTQAAPYGAAAIFME